MKRVTLSAVEVRNQKLEMDNQLTINPIAIN